MTKNAWRRPMRVGEILSGAWSVFRSRLNDLLIMGAVSALPGFASGLLLSPILERLPAFTGEPVFTLTQDEWLLLAGAGIPLTIAGYLALAALYRALFDLSETGEFSIGASYLRTVRRLPALLIAGFLSVVVPSAIAGTIIGLPLSVFLMVAWALAPVTILAEDLGGLKGLGRSRYLVKRNWWHTLYVLLMLVTVMLFLPTLIVFGLFGFLFQNPLSQALMGIVVNAVTTPLFAAGEVALFFDLRARKGEFIGPADVGVAEPVSPGEGA
jgi:hypothetical protein